MSPPDIMSIAPIVSTELGISFQIMYPDIIAQIIIEYRNGDEKLISPILIVSIEDIYPMVSIVAAIAQKIKVSMLMLFQVVDAVTIAPIASTATAVEYATYMLEVFLGSL